MDDPALPPFHRSGNTWQSRCSNRRRNRNRQRAQRHIFPRKLTVKYIGLLLRKTVSSQYLHNHEHVNQIRYAENRRTRDNRPCRFYHPSGELASAFLVFLPAPPRPPHNIRTYQRIAEQYNQQPCRRTNARAHYAASRRQRNIFLTLRHSHADEYVRQINTEKSVEYLFNNLRNCRRHHSIHALEIPAEYRHYRHNKQRRTQYQDRIITVWHFNQRCKIFRRKKHQHRKQKPHRRRNQQ